MLLTTIHQYWCHTDHKHNVTTVAVHLEPGQVLGQVVQVREHARLGGHGGVVVW